METMGRMGVYAEASADLLFRRTYAAADSLFRRVGLDRTYGMRPAEFSEVIESSWPVSSNASCQDAQPGSMCYHATAWLHDKGVVNHPEWYPSLSEESTMSEVQFTLYALGKAFCPMPCKARFAKPLEESPDDRVLEVDDSGRQVESEAYELSEPEECGETVEGDWCYLSIMWLKHVGLGKHPDWYPTLLGESSMEKFQSVLHDEHKVGCPLPCSNSSVVEQATTTPPRQDARAVVSPSAKRVDTVFKQCKNARKGSSCYDAITQVIDVGLMNNPEEYPELTPDVTRLEVQEHLFLRGQFECERPCPSEKIEKLGRPRMVKKSADDMTVEELSRYLSHEWDGYVDSDEYTSSVATHVRSAQERAFEDYTNAVAQDGRQGQPVEEDANAAAERVWEGANAAAAGGVAPAEGEMDQQPPVAAEGALVPERDQKSLENQGLSAGDAADGCRDTSDGELCYSAVTWARKVGIIERPKWYAGLSQNSTFKDFQAYLHKERGSLCQMPCPDAADALPLVWSDGAWAFRLPDPPAAEGDALAGENVTGPASLRPPRPLWRRPSRRPLCRLQTGRTPRSRSRRLPKKTSWRRTSACGRRSKRSQRRRRSPSRSALTSSRGARSARSARSRSARVPPQRSRRRSQRPPQRRQGLAFPRRRCQRSTETLRTSTPRFRRQRQSQMPIPQFRYPRRFFILATLEAQRQRHSRRPTPQFRSQRHSRRPLRRRSARQRRNDWQRRSSSARRVPSTRWRPSAQLRRSRSQRSPPMMPPLRSSRWRRRSLCRRSHFR
jgi:hypothetical protein